MSSNTQNQHQVIFSPQISPEQVQLIADKGYQSIVCNRPDGEEMGQPTMSAIEQACQEAGIAFKSIPFSGGMLTQAMVEEFAEFFNQAPQPMYLYCRSGNRSNVIYQTAIQLGLLD